MKNGKETEKINPKMGCRKFKSQVSNFVALFWNARTYHIMSNKYNLFSAFHSNLEVA